MFSLSKWYGDCIADNGDSVLLYKGRLRWGGVSVNYASILEDRLHAARETSFSLRREGLPKVNGEYCRWTSTALRLDAIWKALQPPVADIVYRSPEGIVEWWCGWPRAHARVKLIGKPLLEGCGYVEHLNLTIAPWHLPVRELLWGHVTAGEDAAVWIHWIGEFSKSVAFFNGVRQTAAVVSDDRVCLDDGVTVQLDRSRCLREGAVGSTSLAIIQGAVKIFPASILAVNETKWRSRALIRRPNAPDASGWAIHERVVWP